MRLLRALPLALGLTLVTPASATAWNAGDTLTVIWRPLPNLPALVRPGDTLTVWANAPAGAGGWAATLRFAGLSVGLAPAGGSWREELARWVLRYRVPMGMPEEIYDLVLSCDGCGTDTARHAVKLLPEFRRDFYFAQVTDTHLPEHTFSSSPGFSTADTSGMADFAAVIEDLNIIHPEFVLHTGDLVNEGELEDWLEMHEYGRAQAMISRLQAPLFLVSGNHDIGGWQATPPPDGTARRAWWRYFGWPFLLDPPPGEPHHSQDYSFDYALLHCVGLEAYVNSGGYDSFRPDIWGAQSFTAEQMRWLAADLAAVPPGRAKLLFYHYDFGGTLADGSPGPSFSQIAPAALGVQGAIWGHYHGVPEGDLAARPFNLGLQSVIGGGRTFRVFRVHGDLIAPGPMRHSGGGIDSLSLSWSGPNDGTQARLTALVTNLFPETWEHARILFVLADHDSSFRATGAWVGQTIRTGGIAYAYVDCVIPAEGTRVISVVPVAPVGSGDGTVRLDAPRPNPFRPAEGPLAVRYATSIAGPMRVGVYDPGGRLVATLFSGRAEAGEHTLAWDGRTDRRVPAGPGLYLILLRAEAGERRQKLVVVR